MSSRKYLKKTINNTQKIVSDDIIKSIKDGSDGSDSIDIDSLVGVSSKVIDINSSDSETNETDDAKKINMSIAKKSKIVVNQEKKTPSTVPKKKPKSQRVIMYLNDDDAKPVTAAGALFYKQVGKRMMILLIENEAKYEDIGGKIDPGDADIISAAGREIEEETNGQIKGDDVMERLKIAPYIYVPRSKYVIYLVEASSAEKKLKKIDFGDREDHDGFARTIGWISREELSKPATVQFKINWRIKCKSLFDKLMDIESQFKFKNNMFKNKKDKS
jgi:hypothetical protein